MRLLPWIAIAAALATASCSLFGGGIRPNLLVITVDSLRFDAISKSLGAARTPNLHALADEGQCFTHCYSHSPAALPAHVALFSARLPHESGVIGNGLPIDPEVTLLAEWMRSRGYSTAAAVSLASLWPPGPDETPAHGSAHASASSRAPKLGLDRGFGSYAVGEHELTPATEVNERLLGQLDALPKDQPWFLFAQYSEPHAPYDAWGAETTTATVLLDGKEIASIAASEAGEWRQELELGPGTHEIVFECDVPIELRRFACDGSNHALASRFVEGDMHSPAKRIAIAVENDEQEGSTCTLGAWVHDVPDLEHARARYRLEIEAVDRALGQLIDALKERGVYDNTLIVLTSDHGESLGEHGRLGGGGNLYDELLRIPVIVKPQRRCEDFQDLAKQKHAPMRQIDIVPTALDLLDVRSMPGAEGVSLLEPAERTVYAEVHPPEVENTMLCARDERYKLVYTAGSNRWEMYDVTADTLEVDDVYELQGHFRATWQMELRKLAASSPQSANARMGMAPKRPEYLKALGY